MTFAVQGRRRKRAVLLGNMPVGLALTGVPVAGGAVEVKVSWPVLEVGVGETRLSGVALLVPGEDEQAIDAATASRATTKAAAHQPVLATTARKRATSE